jgi:RimJ/RimL family protein N-acetyltransferase
MPCPPALIELPAVLRAERITLRPYVPTDAPAVWEAVEETREVLQRWLGMAGAHGTPDASRQWIVRIQARWLLREELVMGIFRDEDGCFLGNTGLYYVDWTLPRFEIGYWLRASAEGCGYAGEAVRRLTRFAFEDLGAQRVEIRCDEQNERSRRVAERQGFVCEALLRNDRIGPRGDLRSTLVFALIASDYPLSAAQGGHTS